jgi:hypothetical protein
MNVYWHTALVILSLLFAYWWGKRDQKDQIARLMFEQFMYQSQDMEQWIQKHRQAEQEARSLQPELFDMEQLDEENNREPGILTLPPQ